MSSRQLVCLAVLTGIGAVTLIVSAAMESGPTITLEKPVYFTSPSGDDVVLGPGTFEIEATKDGLRLEPKDGKRKDAKVVQAHPRPHQETLQSATAMVEAYGQDGLRMTWLH